MSRMPRLTGGDEEMALSRTGFEVVRQRGSHLILKHEDGQCARKCYDRYTRNVSNAEVVLRIRAYKNIKK